mgnify:CR=1 FL=1|jgi:hypothetical protein
MACGYGALNSVTIAVHHSPYPYRELAPASWGLFLPKIRHTRLSTYTTPV